MEGIHIRSIVEALRDLGHKVTVISPSGCDPFFNNVTDLPKKNHKMRKLFYLISSKSPEFIFELLELIYNIPSYFHLRKKIKEMKPDIIYERYFLFSISSNILSIKYGIPIIYEVNDSSFVTRLRHLKFNNIATSLEKRVFLRANYIIAVSHYFKNILIEKGIPENKIIVAHNGVNPNLFNPDQLKDVGSDLPQGRFVIGFVGLFVKWVGLDLIVHVFNDIRKQYENAHLLLVGSGPEEEQIKELIGKLALAPYVTITGAVPHDHIPFYISKMDVCVIPKHEKYTSPVKLFEYMAMGKGVLAPASESIREILYDGKNGMLFEPNNEESMAKVLREMMDSPELLVRLGQNARNNVLTRYTWRANAVQIEEAVKTIIK